MTERIKHLPDMIEFPKHGILSVDIAETDAQDVTLFCMPEGTSIGGHTSTMEAAIYTIRGTAEWQIGDGTHTVKEGDWFFMPKNEIHAIKAITDYVFLLTLHK